LLAGAVYVTVAVYGLVAVAVPTVGASGTVAVVILLLAAVAVLFPAGLVAYTVKVYAVLGVNPVTVMIPDPDWLTIPVLPPGLLTAI
jgi:hypothetical protein